MLVYLIQQKTPMLPISPIQTSKSLRPLLAIDMAMWVVIYLIVIAVII